MASQYQKVAKVSEMKTQLVLGPQPFNRDSLSAAFGKYAKAGNDGQDLAGSGALVFEGEVLEYPIWH